MGRDPDASRRGLPAHRDAGLAPGSQADPFHFDVGRFLLLVWRGVRRHCPNCGAGGLFRRWLAARKTCPSCRLKLDRGESDYFLGGFTINFVGAELLVFGGGLAAVFVTWPDPPWTAIQWSLYVLVVVVPVLTYPFAKTLWLALDLAFRPLTLSDIEGHGENGTAPETPS